VSAELVTAAADGWLARFADQRFSLTDSVSFELMRSRRIVVAFAFDDDFLTAGFARLV